LNSLAPGQRYGHLRLLNQIIRLSFDYGFQDGVAKHDGICLAAPSALMRTQLRTTKLKKNYGNMTTDHLIQT
jgi:hypothetical protein